MIEIEAIRSYLLALQNDITDALCDLDSTLELQEDEWQREEGGGGRSRVMRDGDRQASISLTFLVKNYQRQPLRIVPN